MLWLLARTRGWHADLVVSGVDSACESLYLPLWRFCLIWRRCDIGAHKKEACCDKVDGGLTKYHALWRESLPKPRNPEDRTTLIYAQKLQIIEMQTIWSRHRRHIGDKLRFFSANLGTNISMPTPLSSGRPQRPKEKTAHEIQAKFLAFSNKVLPMWRLCLAQAVNGSSQRFPQDICAKTSEPGNQKLVKKEPLCSHFFWRFSFTGPHLWKTLCWSKIRQVAWWGILAVTLALVCAQLLTVVTPFRRDQRCLIFL